MMYGARSRPVKNLTFLSRVLGLRTQVHSLGLGIRVLVLRLEAQVLVNITGQKPIASYLPKYRSFIDSGAAIEGVRGSNDPPEIYSWYQAKYFDPRFFSKEIFSGTQVS